MENPLIISDPQVLGAQPIVAGTHITVSFILDSLYAGKTPQQLIAKHPDLTQDVIKAAKIFVLEATRQQSIDTNRIPVRIRHIMTALEPNEIVTLIYDAFADARLVSGPSLRQMPIIDNYGRDNMDRELSHHEYVVLKNQDETSDWTKIAVEDIERYGSYLAYADALSFCFHIPALMINRLVNSSSQSSLLFHLCYSTKEDYLEKHRMMQYSLLNDKRKFAIANFLQHLLSFDKSEDFSHHRKEVEEGMANYWLQYLHPPIEKPNKKRKTRRR